MKKFLLLLAAGLTLATPNLWADGENLQDPPLPPPPPIPLNPSNPNPNPGNLEPRNVTPIYALYNNGILELYFAADLGTVTATVTNTSTGEMWSESGNSNDGVLVVDITPNVGNYSVTIETESGDIYLGLFAL